MSANESRQRCKGLIVCALLLTTPQPVRAGDGVHGDRVLVVATLQDSKFTGWSRNWCDGGILEPGAGFGCSDGGLSFGGEIYKVRLTSARVVLGHLPTSVKYIGVPAHALRLPWYSERLWLLILAPAPTRFAADTGLTYFAADDGEFVSSVACLQFDPIGMTFGIQEPASSVNPGHQSCYALNTILHLSTSAVREGSH